MQLNEIIENFGYENIHKRTMISVRNLQQLANREVDQIPRVKAMGLISILEREFRIELDSLRSEFNELYAHEPEKLNFDPAKVVMTADAEDERGGISGKLLLLLPVAVLALAVWYFFLRDEKIIDIFNTNDEKTGLVKSVESEVKDSISINNITKPSSISELSIPKAQKKELTEEEKIIQELKNEQKKIIKKQEEEKQKQKQKEKEKRDALTIESIVSTEKNNTQLEVQDVVDTTKAEEVNASNSVVSTPSTDATPAKMNTDDLPAQEPKQETEKTVFKLPEAFSAEPDNIPAKEPVVAPKPTPKPVVKSNKISSTATKVIFHPKGKVWVGYTNLNNMKRKSVVLTKDMDLALNSKNTTYILLAGNRNFSFYSHGRLQKVPRINLSMYYKIRNGKITSITKEQFQQLNQSTRW